MLEILERHLRQNVTDDMQRRLSYLTYLATVQEIDTLPTRIQQLAHEITSPSQITAHTRTILSDLGFTAEVSHIAPGLHFTFSRTFAPLAIQHTEDEAIRKRTAGAIVFARGTDEDPTHTNAFECSSLLAGIVITSQTVEADDDLRIPNDRFTLAFMTGRKTYQDEHIHDYPFPDGTERQCIEGTLTHTEADMLVNVTSHTPEALHALQQIMEIGERRQRQMTIEHATCELLTHFFVDTPAYTPGPFLHFYRPKTFPKVVTLSE